jgi:Bacterial regulatory proteins, gntR family
MPRLRPSPRNESVRTNATHGRYIASRGTLAVSVFTILHWSPSTNESVLAMPTNSTAATGNIAIAALGEKSVEQSTKPNPAQAQHRNGAASAEANPPAAQPLISPFDGRPLYKQVAAILRDRIATGVYPAGSIFPTARSLMAEFTISDKIAHAAVNVLAHEGLIDKCKGRPTRVQGARHREPVPLHPGDAVIARMPTPQECSATDISPGVPVFLIEDRAIPADRVVLIVDHPNHTDPPHQPQEQR